MTTTVASASSSPDSNLSEYFTFQLYIMLKYRNSVTDQNEMAKFTTHDKSENVEKKKKKESRAKDYDAIREHVLSGGGKPMPKSQKSQLRIF